MNKFGLIGRKLGHSWSQQWFDEMFAREHIVDTEYRLYERENLDGLREWVAAEGLRGFNVTIPYKKEILPLLDDITPEAREIGAVNCVSVVQGRLLGCNTDAPALLETLRPLLQPWHTSALVLGTGGAAMAAGWALRQLGIDYRYVSRHPERPDAVSYLEAEALAADHYLIINATPVGMYPDEAQTPWPYSYRLGMKHLCYDLVYNPGETRFLLESELRGATTQGGLVMLHRQAELSWERWSGDEMHRAMQTLTSLELFAPLAGKILPDVPAETLRSQLLQVDTPDEFQRLGMMPLLQYIIDNSMTELTVSGEAWLDADRPCIYVSNHRDILVDAMMLEYKRVKHGLPTTHLVVGSNLYSTDLLALLARANKMFAIGRGGAPRERYAALMTMSQYLRHLVTERGESVWIAQRNGRAKDGRDITDPALIKMFALSGDRRDPVAALESLQLVPMSISYEWEPCAALKARERCLSQGGHYTKVPGEDTQSMLTGMKEWKGRVHLALGEPLRHDELAACQGRPEAVAALLDQRIHEGYRLWDTHYAAAALQRGEAVTGPFVEYIDRCTQQYPDIPGFREALIEIYANPVKFSAPGNNI